VVAARVDYRAGNGALPVEQQLVPRAQVDELERQLRR
jgi:hypothetical protein